MSSPRIVLFATASSPWCAEARAAVAAAGEPWEERDPDRDPEALRDLIMYSAASLVPTVVVGNRVMVGFDPEAFKRLLRLPPVKFPAPADYDRDEREGARRGRSGPSVSRAGDAGREAQAWPPAACPADEDYSRPED